jgi:hypothetical protein
MYTDYLMYLHVTVATAVGHLRNGAEVSAPVVSAPVNAVHAVPSNDVCTATDALTLTTRGGSAYVTFCRIELTGPADRV